MTVFATSAWLEFGQSPPFVPGMLYASTPIGIMGFTGITSSGSPAQVPMKLDFSPSGASVGIQVNGIFSVGGAVDTPFTLAVGSTVIFSYVPPFHTQFPAGEPVKSTGMGFITETLTRVK